MLYTLNDIATRIATTLNWDVFGEDVTGKRLHHLKERWIDGSDWYKVYAPMDAEFNDNDFLQGISIIVKPGTDIVSSVWSHHIKLHDGKYQSFNTPYFTVDDFIAQLPNLA